MTTPVAKKTIGSKVAAPAKTVVAPVAMASATKQCPPNPPLNATPVKPVLQAATVLSSVLEKKRGGGLTKEAKAKKEAEKTAKLKIIRGKLVASLLADSTLLADPSEMAAAMISLEDKVVLQYDLENPSGRVKSDGHDGRGYTPQEVAQVAVFSWTQKYGKNMTEEQVMDAWKFAMCNPKAPRAKTKSVKPTTPPAIAEIPE
jgi:hypothetical protein